MSDGSLLGIMPMDDDVTLEQQQRLQEGPGGRGGPSMG